MRFTGVLKGLLLAVVRNSPEAAYLVNGLSEAEHLSDA